MLRIEPGEIRTRLADIKKIAFPLHRLFAGLMMDQPLARVNTNLAASVVCPRERLRRRSPALRRRAPLGSAVQIFVIDRREIDLYLWAAAMGS